MSDIDHGGVKRLPKLRSSCDACQSLKIKCGQEKPICRRCLANGIDCVYGFSRRRGKPRRTVASTSISPPQSTAEISTMLENDNLDSFFDLPMMLSGNDFVEPCCADSDTVTTGIPSTPPSDCTCYLIALRTLEQFENSSQPSTEVAFDTLLALISNALRPTAVIAECSRCLSRSSYLLIFSLLVGKMVSLCLAGCEAYRIGESERQEVADIRCIASKVRVGGYEISEKEEKIVVRCLIKEHLREIEGILAKLRVAAEKLSSDGQGNGCKEVLAYAARQLNLCCALSLN